MGLAGDGLDHGLADTRLTDAGLAGQQNRLTFAARRLSPALKQQAELLVAADDRRDAPDWRAANRLSNARSPRTAKADTLS